MPDLADVRPFVVLKDAFEHVRAKLKQDHEGHYEWARNQLQGIRQDLIVQGLENEFTVEVLETMIELVIGQWDMVLFASCLSDLDKLYDAGIPGRPLRFLVSPPRCLVFLPEG